MNKIFQKAIEELEAAKLKYSSHDQTQVLVEKASAIIRHYGDEGMMNTYGRLTTFRATTSPSDRYSKTLKAIDLMIDELKLKAGKEELISKNIIKENTFAKYIYKWAGESTGLFVTIVFGVIGGAFTVGFVYGSYKDERDKLDMHVENKSLKLKVDSILISNDKMVIQMQNDFNNAMKAYNVQREKADSLLTIVQKRR